MDIMIMQGSCGGLRVAGHGWARPVVEEEVAAGRGAPARLHLGRTHQDHTSQGNEVPCLMWLMAVGHWEATAHMHTAVS